jgi:xylan 1,4-beta-xylosidase
MRTSLVTTRTGLRRSVGLFSVASALSSISVAGCDTGDIVDQNPDMPAAPAPVGGSPGTGPGPAAVGGSPATNAGSGGAGAGRPAVGGSGGVTVIGMGGGFNPPPAGAGGLAVAGGAANAGTSGASTGGLVGTPATCKSSFASVALEGAPHSVKIDGASSKGALPHFWNTYGIGHMAAFLQTENNWGEILKAHVKDGVANLGLTSIRAHGLFHDDLGIYKEENGGRVYDFTKSDLIFDFLVENGVQPIVELGSMPSALASDPSLTWFLWKMGTSPPKDFTLWQELVFKFAEHSLQRYGADVVSKWYWEVWNEPECCRGQFWDGTLDQYFELYDHALAGVTKAIPNAKVGGPVASQPVELTGNSELGKKFLEHVTKDSYVTPGQPGRVDVFMYHSWSFLDGSINGYFTGLDLLDSYGLKSTPIAITEFGPTWEFNLHDEPQENEHGAAFVAQTYADIAQRCAKDNKRFPLTYAWWTLSDIFKEDNYRDGEPFIGAMGLISRENLHKPAYNAYKFLAQMGNEQVSLTTGGSAGLGGMAARDGNGGVQILVYNGQSPGKGPTNDVYYTAGAEQEIAVTVSGLDATKPYDVTAYRIDEKHGNAYSVWEAKGRPAMSAMSEADWAELRGAMDSAPEPQAQSQCGSTYTGRFPLASPGVLFVKITPTPPTPQ